jgi:2-keto-4-pentenoate hydratase/2-oxohepta-3-ene-1,7-dioic acid hydratase in catechol pathway
MIYKEMPKPTKIVAVGLNYREHAKELGMEIPQSPCIFIKPPTTVIYNEGAIVYPSQSRKVDYEAELAIVIKEKTHNIQKGDVKKHILGYTCANDITARDLQKLDGQWTRAKSFDTFCPIGPVITDEVDPDNLKIKLYVNKILKQEGCTKDFIFDINTLVSFISSVMTLFPGDVILTGTPKGVGPLNIGDVVEVEVEGIGVLKNYVKACVR